jgi:hypothetical protein
LTWFRLTLLHPKSGPDEGHDVRGQITGEPIDRTGDSDVFSLDLIEGTTISITAEVTFVYISQDDYPPGSVPILVENGLTYSPALM